MGVLGIDCGSRFVKMVLMEGSKITYKKQVSTIEFYKTYCIPGERLALRSELFSDLSIEAFYTTGYGRNHMAFSESKPINELKAHAWGAMYRTGLQEFVLLDIGGQDVKVIRVEKGLLTDMALNEKCAASCGRYLENMANVLGVSVEVMSQHFDRPAPLSSTCAVFAESELIGQIARGIPLEELYAGVNYSLYQRLVPLLKDFQGELLLVSGGVAHNFAILHYLRQHYPQVRVLESPSYNGAIGCAAFGVKHFKKEGDLCIQ